jgi:hypothetical protein
MRGSVMAEADEKWSIDKLKGSNKTTWNFLMRHLLLAKGLWGYVVGVGKAQWPRYATALLRDDC